MKTPQKTSLSQELVPIYTTFREKTGMHKGIQILRELLASLQRKSRTANQADT